MTENTYLAYGECYQVMPRAVVQRPVLIGFDMAKGSDSYAVVDVQLVAAEEGSRLSSIGGDDWPHGATVKLRWVGSYHDDGKPGWAKRDAQGNLVSAYSLTRLDPDCWDVVAERAAAQKGGAA